MSLIPVEKARRKYYLGKKGSLSLGSSLIYKNACLFIYFHSRASFCLNSLFCRHHFNGRPRVISRAHIGSLIFLLNFIRIYLLSLSLFNLVHPSAGPIYLSLRVRMHLNMHDEYKKWSKAMNVHCGRINEFQCFHIDKHSLHPHLHTRLSTSYW